MWLARDVSPVSSDAPLASGTNVEGEAPVGEETVETDEATITDDAEGPRDSVFVAYSDTQRAVRSGRYKLIEFSVDGRRRTELYDVEADPAETENLAGDSDHDETLDRLREELAHWRECVDDPALGD